MMSNFYTGVMILSLLAMSIMSVIASQNPTLSKIKNKQLIICYVVVILGALFEWGAIYIGVVCSFVWLHVLVKTLELSIAPAIPLAVVPAISNSKKLYRIMFAIVIANAVIEILSAFFGFVFYVDASNVYHHADFYFLYIGAYIAETICLIAGYIKVVKEYQVNRLWIMIPILLYMFLGIGMQLADSSIRVSYIAISISLVFLYVSYEDAIQSSDSLTGMLNRHSYDNRIMHLTEESTIISIDIDFFKRCNDTYGHVFGDDILKEVSSVIKESLGRDGLCYRTGGDEFCVIVPGKDNETEKKLENLHASMEKRRAVIPRLPYISTGYAVFDPAKDNVLEVVDRADAMMYNFKNLRKHLMAEGRELNFTDLLEILKRNPLSISKG